MNKTITPPKLAHKLLLKFLRDDLIEEVEGDLEENFRSALVKTTTFSAKVQYWYQVINYIRPFAIRKSSSNANSFYMLENHFRIGWRNLTKQKVFSLIKILGFAIGIAACLLIALFIKDEVSYDKFIPEKERLYRVVGVFKKDGKDLKDVWFPAPFGPALKNDYPEVELSARLNPSPLFGAGSNEIRRTDEVESFHETGFTYTDPEFFTILKIPMVYGNGDRALDKPNTIVLSKSKADKYFPNQNPIGKILILNNDEKRQYTIAGVMEDFPANSHLHQYHFLMTLRGFEPYKGEPDNWMANNYPTYIKLRPGSDVKATEKKLLGVVDKYIVPIWKANDTPNIDEILKNIRLELQPVTDIHLYSADIQDGLSHGDIRLVWLFGGIAAFILLIACINFINLSTAKSANRAKEVGIRKVMGSFRDHLVKQFLVESTLYSFISFFIGFVLAGLLLPYFNVLSAKSIVFPWTEWWLIPALIGASLTVGLFAGLYPSFYLSAFRPIEVLKGKVALGSKNSGLRSTLVIFQFTTSIILIICTIVIYQQMNFILSKKVGFDKEQVLLIQGTNTLGDQITAFREELKNLSSVENVSISSYLPIKGTMRNGNGFWVEGKQTEADQVNGQRWVVDEEYVSTMGMKLIDGRDFLPMTSKDSATAIVNQMMVKELGLKNPIGERITNGWETFTIIGVVGDFHFESMKVKISPVVMGRGISPGTVAVKMKGNDVRGALDGITSVWKKFAPNQSIRYTFMDESFARMYEDVQRLGRIFITFAVLAIVVACLGLFALSAFMVEQRSKEISIRMVLGASITTIFNLLTLNFVKLVVISFVIASPLAWMAMKEWLKEYQYKISIGGEIFLYAGLTALIIAISTVSYQSVRAAFGSPIKNLRSE